LAASTRKNTVKHHDPDQVQAEAIAAVERLSHQTTLSETVLSQVNVLREALGWPTLAELPTGALKQAQGDPIACALTGPGYDATVTMREILLNTGRDVYEIPTSPEMKAFISAFDRGLLSRYVTKKVKRVSQRPSSQVQGAES
jgi:hypothetical protein